VPCGSQSIVTKEIPMSSKAAERIRSLQEKAQRAQSQIRQIEEAERKREQENQRRREVLVGAVVLELVERGEWPRERLREALDKKLSRPRDRQLFELPVDPALAVSAKSDDAVRPAVVNGAAAESR
jgi:hypothetical protein